MCPFNMFKTILSIFRFDLEMGKKEKVTIAKPPSDYFAGVSLDVKNVASVTANLSSVEVPILSNAPAHFMLTFSKVFFEIFPLIS